MFKLDLTLKLTQMLLEVPLSDAPPLAVIPAIRRDLSKLSDLLTRHLKNNPTDQEVVTCIEFLSVLLKIVIDVDSQKPPFFGVEIFLSDIEKLFDDPIRKLKSATNDFTTEIIQNEYDIIVSLSNELNALTYVCKNYESGNASDNTKFLKSKSFKETDFSTLELDNYLKVGSALKDDEITQLLISEIEKIHLDSYAVSPYLSIIGPSYMGKTQTAFTLSHKIDLIYVNLSTTLAIDHPRQTIYIYFKRLAKLFSKCIEKDIKHKKFSKTLGNAEDIQDLEYPFRTLGLIYVLFRMRKHKKYATIKDWYLDIINIDSMMIPCLEIGEFQSKFEDFKAQVVFIDELPEMSSSSVRGEFLDKIKFLRNLCRAVKLPCILSGTNSTVNNLISGCNFNVNSRGGDNEKPWVQVTVKTPKATLNSLCKLVKIDSNRTLEVYLLNNDLDYNRIFIDFYGQNGNLAKFEPIKKLLQLIIRQSSTSLPGLTTLILNNLFHLLSIHKNDLSKIWVELIKETGSHLNTRKESLTSFEGLLASAHILVFDSSPLKKGIEEGQYSAIFVEKHLFYYGVRDEVTFRLNCRKNRRTNKFELVRNGSVFSDKCNFPELEDDFFTAFLCLSMWQFSEFTQTGSDYGIFTLAGIYQEYLDKGAYKIGVNRNIPNSLSLEILAHWSICFASHQNLNGQNGGKDFFIKFAQQLQSFHIENGPVAFSGLTDIPASLEGIFSRVKVPYLMKFPKNDFKQIIEQYLGDFIKFGESNIVLDSEGKDIVFDLEFDDNPRKGFVECKLWINNIGSPEIYESYKRACFGNYPLSFLVCKKMIEEIDFSSKETQNLPKMQTRSKCPKLSQSNETKTTEREQSDYGALCKEFWNSNEGNHIDIYTVKYEVTKIIGVNDAKFNVEKEKSFENSKGAFIVIESSFNPPNLDTNS